MRVLAAFLHFLGNRGRERAETGEKTKAGEMRAKDREAAAKGRLMDRIKIWGFLFVSYRFSACIVLSPDSGLILSTWGRGTEFFWRQKNK